MKNKLIQIIGIISTYSITCSFIILYLYIIKQNVITEEGNMPYVNLFSFIMILISTFIYLFVFNIFDREKSKSIFKITFIFYYVIFEALLCFFIKQYKLLVLLIPFSFFQYITTNVLFNSFKYHRLFMELIGDKSGKELETYLYHNNILAQDFSHQISKANLLSLVLSGIFFLTVFLCEYYKIINLQILIITLVFYFSVFCCLIINLYFNNESYYANMGFVNIIKNKRSYLKTIITIFLISNVFGFVLSSKSPLIKVHFKEVQKREYIVKQKDSPLINNSFDEMELKENLEDTFGQSKENPLLDLIVEIIQIVLVCGLIIGILYLFIKPFFTSEWKTFWRERKLGEYLKKIFGDFVNFWKELFSSGNKKENYSKVDAKNFRDSINSFVHRSKKSKEKKLELDRITQKFMYVIKWGEKKSIIYKKSMAPLEYCQLIIEFFKNENADDSLKKAAETVGNIFEKALYDKELLTKDEENEYNKAVGQLTIYN